MMRRLALFGKRGRDCFFGTGTLVALLLCQGPASAQPSALARHPIEQPAQALADTLRSIARQTGASVLFEPGAVSGRQSRAVSGHLTAAEAIARAIDGSGLAVEVLKDGALVVRPAVAAGAGPGGAGRPPAPAPADAEGPAPEPRQIERVEVTGSRLRRLDAEGPLPVNVYRREDIARSGQPTLERYLSSLNEASVSPGEGAFGGNVGQGSVQLRGLPLGSTLVLVNGRRVQAVGSSSANFFNLNLIPMAAVERVEVVPVGSSAVYGGDALAGVVNIILKKAMNGQTLEARLAGGSGFEDGSLSVAAGRQGARGGFVLLGAVSKATPLAMSERGFFRDADYRRFGGVDARSTLCAPGTVTSSTAANLPGLTATSAGIPARTAGQALTPGSFVATAGRPHLCSDLAQGNGYALAHGTQTLSLHAAGDRQPGEAWTVFGELTLSDDRLSTMQGGLQLNNVLVPASNVHNPFGVPVRVSATLGPENGSRGFSRSTLFTRVLGGVRGELAAGWELEATASTARDDGEQRLANGTVNTAARTAALRSPTAAAALDPFTAGQAASADVLRSIWQDNVRSNTGRKDQLGAFVRGTLFTLPAGPVDAIVGAEAARDRYATTVPGSVAVDTARGHRAVYGELRAPLWRGEAQGPGRGHEAAALTLAGRRDRYSDFGAASTYQAGLELRPTREVLLRASAASSFKPPTLLQTNVDDISLAPEAIGLVDPARGKAPVLGGEILRTTNPALKPEQGKAYALGAAWEPAPGARGLTAWRVQVDGLIGLLWPQVTLDNEALFPGFVTRGPAVGGVPGAVTRVLYTETNFGLVQSSGLDLEAGHGWRAAGGAWTAAATATKTLRYGVVIAPGSPLENRLGRRFADYWAPAWKGRVSLGYDRPGWGLGITGRYLGSYRDAGTSERRLGGIVTVDLAGRMDLKRMAGPLGGALGAVDGATLSLGIVNLGNRQPQYVGTSPYYDVTQADWRGRTASLRLAVNW